MIDERIIKNDERVVLALRRLYQNYGYVQYKMSRFEEYDLYVRNKDFLVSDEVITFTDHSGRLLALKPDVTLSIIKNTVDHPGMVQKVYYNENVYRVAKGSHSFKEIMQAGLECIGDVGGYEIAEVVLLAAKSLALINPNYVLDISHMGLLSAMLEESGLRSEAQSKALGFINQKNVHELVEFCQREGIPEVVYRKLAVLPECTSLEALAPYLSGTREKKEFEEFRALYNILEESSVGNRLRVDFSVGNDMKYYSGVVFKGYIEGIPTGVLAGGQYDKLFHKMGRKSGAIGFAVYLDLLERIAPRQEQQLEILLLHDKDVDPAVLVKMAEELAAQGNILVAEQMPEQMRAKKILRLTKKGVEEIG